MQAKLTREQFKEAVATLAQFRAFLPATVTALPEAQAVGMRLMRASKIVLMIDDAESIRVEIGE
jgi:hypothetical protein